MDKSTSSFEELETGSVHTCMNAVLHFLQMKSKAALRDFVVAKERHRRAKAAGRPEGHSAPLLKAERAYLKAADAAEPTRDQALLAREEAARILRGDTEAGRCRCKVCGAQAEAVK